MKLQNTAIPFEAYNIPVPFTDRGRDFASTADDRLLTLYSLDRAYVGRRADLLTNDPLTPRISRPTTSRSSSASPSRSC